MPLFEIRNAQLNELDGMGYLFLNTIDQVQGVFYTNPEDVDLSEELKKESDHVFKGILYKTNRAGTIQESKTEMEVDVVNVSSVPLGEQAIIVAS